MSLHADASAEPITEPKISRTSCLLETIAGAANSPTELLY